MNSTTVSIGRDKKGPDGSRPAHEMKTDASGSDGDDLSANADGNDRGIRLFAMDGALASEDAALIDDQRTDHDVAEHFSGRQDLQATRGADIALNRATDHAIRSTNTRPAVIAIRRRSDRKYGTRSSGITAS